MINLIHRKSDFGIEASWTFCASGHGTGPSDGMGATVKSSANRSIIKSGATLSTPQNFFDFTKKINEKAAKSKCTDEPPINAYYLSCTTIDDITETLLSDRFEQLNGRKYSLRIQRRRFVL